MRKISKLAALSPGDQQHVLGLCENNRYEDVVPILAKPRSQGGLDLKTSRTASVASPRHFIRNPTASPRRSSDSCRFLKQPRSIQMFSHRLSALSFSNTSALNSPPTPRSKL